MAKSKPTPSDPELPDDASAKRASMPHADAPCGATFFGKDCDDRMQFHTGKCKRCKKIEAEGGYGSVGSPKERSDGGYVAARRDRIANIRLDIEEAQLQKDFEAIRSSHSNGHDASAIAEGMKPMADLVAKLSERMDAEARDREKREERERHERELTQLKAQLAKPVSQGLNIVTRRVPATDPVHGGPMLGPDNAPLYIVIEEPYNPSSSRSEADIAKVIGDSVREAIRTVMAAKPDDGRTAVLEAELKTLKEERRIENALGPIYSKIAEIQKDMAQRTPHPDELNYRRDNTMLSEGFDVVKMELSNLNKKSDRALEMGTVLARRLMNEPEGKSVVTRDLSEAEYAEMERAVAALEARADALEAPAAPPVPRRTKVVDVSALQPVEPEPPKPAPAQPPTAPTEAT